MSESTFQFDSSTVPFALHHKVNQYFEAQKLRCQEEDVPFPDDPHFLEHLVYVVACSEFIADALLKEPHLLTLLSGLQKLPSSIKSIEQQLAKANNEEEFKQTLRILRRQELVKIAWFDLLQKSDLNTTILALSNLADTLIQQTAKYYFQILKKRLGTPVDQQGEEQEMLVIAVGKLGGKELNFSSDVDLIFVYPEVFEFQNIIRQQINEDIFYSQLGQQVIKAISDVTIDGFAFRVDMRLRPFGEAGPLVMSLSALEDYYQQHGREWERYALIKARVISGSPKNSKQLMAMLRPFVYRRYIDYSVFDSLREMKGLIELEVKKRQLEENIKQGWGGIRQVEFIGQVFQLVRGGREPIFQQREILTVLEVLKSHKMIETQDLESLKAAYIFLRNLEHRLQMAHDQQVQILPKDTLEKSRLAFSMGYEGWETFYQALTEHRKRVSELFNRVTAGPISEPLFEEPVKKSLSSLWDGSIAKEEAIQRLSGLGFHHGDEAYDMICEFHGQRNQEIFSRRGRERLAKLIPTIIKVSGYASKPEVALSCLFSMLKSIGKRSSYLALLVENTPMVELLSKLSVASPWIAQQISQFPDLLDELLDARRLYQPKSRAEFQEELSNQLRWIDEDDLEHQMECLRQFKLSNTIRVAAVDVMGKLPIKRVSDYLTEIAEVVLTEVVQIAWNQLVKRYGYPKSPTGIDKTCEFAIIAYGKLGGIELSYSSDIDLVFLHHPPEQGDDNEDRQLSNEEFYIRLGQRVYHMITAVTLSGPLYALDMRLRPMGDSGLLVSSMNAFAEYQRNDAWTWEHQALVRSRFITGSDSLRQKFTSLRREILGRKRDLTILKQDIIHMRQRIMESKPSKSKDVFSLKVDTGGIGDIEFIVQFLVLSQASNYPILLEHTDNLRLLNDLAACGILESKQAMLLQEAYLLYRQEVHRLALLDKEPISSDNKFDATRHEVQTIWKAILLDDSTEDGDSSTSLEASSGNT